MPCARGLALNACCCQYLKLGLEQERADYSRGSDSAASLTHFRTVFTLPTGATTASFPAIHANIRVLHSNNDELCHPIQRCLAARYRPRFQLTAVRSLLGGKADIARIAHFGSD